MEKLFGTDGVRGRVNSELTSEIAFKIGQALSSILLKDNEKSTSILIGKDTRRSCDMLESALASGIMSVSGDVTALGYVPTPAVPYLVKDCGADAGVMISASHNPYCDNGIKIFGADGFKLSDEQEEKIEDIVHSKNKIELADPKDIGRFIYNNEAINKYVNYTLSTVKNIDEIKNLKVLFDCAFGSASVTARHIFSKLNIDAIFTNDNPNGLNINKDAGSTNIHLLKDRVREEGFDLAIAFDGDADRVLFLDEKGNEIDGDYVLAILASDKLITGNLDNKTVVGTVMTNLGVKKYIESTMVSVATTQVGDRFVLEEMVKNNYALGGEQSGHMVLYNFQTTGDGQLTALHVLRKICESEKSLFELTKDIEKSPQILLNIEADNFKKYKIMEDEIILKTIAKWEDRLKENGRVLVRTSGTEPLVRVMVEACDQKILEQAIDDFDLVFKNRLLEI